jgi:glyoxylate/hydroxypyruvate reductase
MHIFVNVLSFEAGDKDYFRAQLPQGYSVIFRNDLAENEQLAAFQNADMLFGNVPLAWFEANDKLQFWQLETAGFDGYDSLKVTFPVANMGDYYAWPCAETIVAGIMAFYRGLPELAVLQTEQKWVGVPIRFRIDLLHKKNVVVLGAGTIGLVVQKILTGFDCNTTLFARTSPKAQIHTLAELKDILPKTDVVINCLPGPSAVKGLFDAELIAAMKAGSIYANVGRGSTNDEAALIAALQSGHLAGAVLDVTEIEPLPTTSPLWAMKQVILTQHTGGGSRNEDRGKIDVFIENLGRYIDNQPIQNLVDLRRGY